MNEPNENLEGVDQNHRFDPAIRLLEKCIKYGAFVTVALGVSYAFFFREVRAFRLPFLVAFFISIDLAGIGALLVAAREISLGMRSRITAAVIWAAIFWGSFGIVVLVGTVLMVRSLL
jgi:uncharacterized membrane protein